MNKITKEKFQLATDRISLLNKSNNRLKYSTLNSIEPKCSSRMKERERFAQGMYTARGAKMENFLPARRQTELYKIKERKERGKRSKRKEKLNGGKED